ncbi:hypothetical protein AKG11_23105 [Shinella sp. SUS2]|nr:hypothetical protein AKG11_23105 [Shinella sp. SUS2]KOC74404.1 hypothetical protein AKG10_17970 [Shinella sp. GWS1]
MKRLMHAFGMALGSDGSPTKKEDRKHANGLWLRFESYRSGHLHGTGYVLSLSDPFIDWDVSQRYANQSNFDQARAQSHQAGAKAVCDLIKKAQREGLI